MSCSKREAISILLAIDGERSIIPFGNFNLHFRHMFINLYVH